MIVLVLPHLWSAQHQSVDYWEYEATYPDPLSYVLEQDRINHSVTSASTGHWFVQ